MPSPLGHALAGLTVHVLTASDSREAASRPRAALIVGAALSPDLDLLGRFLDGQNHHQHELHSLGFALMAGILAMPIARAWGLRAFPTGLAVFLGWSSHVLLDYLAVDTSPPIGLMALWPWSSGYYHFPHPLFLDIGRTLELGTVVHDVWAVLREILILTPVLVLAWRARSFGAEALPWRGDSRANQ
jgi:membrane-bound metal-dependent hydrolase YbcI (DUF457 family)